jgi:hypothetical protein
MPNQDRRPDHEKAILPQISEISQRSRMERLIWSVSGLTI